MAACAIGVQQGDIIIGIYCNIDGEPSITGKILSDHYDCVKSNTLMKYGDAISIGIDIGIPHDVKVDEYVEIDGVKLRAMSSFYARDTGYQGTGEDREEFFKSDKLHEFYTKHRKVEFTYFRSKLGWHVFDTVADEWVLLSTYLAK